MTEREIIKGGNRVTTSFANKLAQRVAQDGMDRKTFADRSGLPAPSVYKWFAGATVPRPANVVKIAEFFNEDAADWLRAAGYPVGSPKAPTEVEQSDLSLLRSFPWIRGILPGLSQIPPSQQQIVVDLVRNLGRRDRDTDQ